MSSHPHAARVRRPVADAATPAVVFRPRTLPVITAAFLVAACGPAQPPGGHGGFPPAAVAVARVEARTLPVVFEYVGQTTGSKDVEIRARVTGILERKLYAEGSPVRAGQPLFSIDRKPLEAQAAAARAEVARAQALVAQADREAARLVPLAERRAIGRKEADDAVSAAELARATMGVARAKLAEVELSLGYTDVAAPISGLSGRAMKSEGSLVTANETLLTVISQVDPIWVPFPVPDGERLAVDRAVAAGRLTLPKDNGYTVSIRLADGSTLPRTGRINFADTRINPATGTTEMRAEIANRDLALRPGQFVRVRLGGAVRRDAIAVPQVAVLEGPQSKFVYVPAKDKDGRDIAQPRPVTLGDWVEADGANLWIVESGLAAGESLIVEGLARLQPGAPIALGPPPGAPAAAGAAPGTKDGAKDARPRS